jgi:hypothetical protein
MRCLTCHRTGFTEPELVAHEKRFQHPRAPEGTNPAEWSTGNEFPQTAPRPIAREDLLAALRALGPEALEALAALIKPAPTPTTGASP